LIGEKRKIKREEKLRGQNSRTCLRSSLDEPAHAKHTHTLILLQKITYKINAFKLSIYQKILKKRFPQNYEESLMIIITVC